MMNSRCLGSRSPSRRARCILDAVGDRNRKTIVAGQAQVKITAQKFVLGKEHNGGVPDSPLEKAVDLLIRLARAILILQWLCQGKLWKYPRRAALAPR